MTQVHSAALAAALPPAALTCPDCGALMVLKVTHKFKLADGSPRKFYGCSTWPRCPATHGAHPDGQPLGVPADEETKKARIAAHAAFDPLWKQAPALYELPTRPRKARQRAEWRVQKRARMRAYRWLAHVLGIPYEECHFGLFDKPTCESAVKVCEGGMDAAAIRGWAKARNL